MEDTYLEEIRLSREFACQFEKHNMAFWGDQYRDLITAYRELKRHYERQIEEEVQ